MGRYPLVRQRDVLPAPAGAHPAGGGTFSRARGILSKGIAVSDVSGHEIAGQSGPYSTTRTSHGAATLTGELAPSHHLASFQKGPRPQCIPTQLGGWHVSLFVATHRTTVRGCLHVRPPIPLSSPYYPAPSTTRLRAHAQRAVSLFRALAREPDDLVVWGGWREGR